MKRNELKDLVKECLNEMELNESGIKTKLPELYNILIKAVEEAEKAYSKGQTDRESFSGTEGNDLGELLKEIWNAFSTGDSNDDSSTGELFK